MVCTGLESHADSQFSDWDAIERRSSGAGYSGAFIVGLGYYCAAAKLDGGPLWTEPA